MAELSAGVNNAFDQHPALWTPAFARQVYVGARMKWDRRARWRRRAGDEERRW
jgi:hypothetical protein